MPQALRGWEDATSEEFSRTGWSHEACLNKLSSCDRFAESYGLRTRALPSPSPRCGDGEDLVCPICLDDVTPDSATPQFTCGHYIHADCAPGLVEHASRTIRSVRADASVLDSTLWPPRCPKPDACRGFLPSTVAARVLHPTSADDRLKFTSRNDKLLALRGPFVRCRGSARGTCRLFVRVPDGPDGGAPKVVTCTCGLRTCSGRGGVGFCSGRPHGCVPCDEAARLERRFSTAATGVEAALASAPERLRQRRQQLVDKAVDERRREMLAAARAAPPGAAAFTEEVLAAKASLTHVRSFNALCVAIVHLT